MAIHNTLLEQFVILLAMTDMYQVLIRVNQDSWPTL